MENLTGQFMTNLVPSSMHGGNTTADDRKYSMSAPGSESVLAVPDRMDNLPLPRYTGEQIPVSNPGRRERVTANHPQAGSGSWTDEETTAGRWKRMP